MDPAVEDRIATALENLALHHKYLGTGDAGTAMGAIEMLAKEVMEGTTRVAEAIDRLADAVARHIT